MKRLLLVAVAAVGAACSRTQGATPPAAPASGGGGGGGGGARALAVRVAPVEAKDLVYAITAVGSLEADEMVQVVAELDGAVSSVQFDEGMRVGRDTVLLRIDPDRYRLEEARAEAAHRRALADQKRAEADLERRETLASENLVAAEELNRSRGETERLGAETAAARAALDIARQNRQRADVRAPRAGVINTRTVSTGQFVKSGAVLATLVDTSRLRLRFKVSEGESLRARPGQTVTFRVSALGAAEFPATLYHVGETADPASRQVEVLAWVKNPGPLKPGFFAEVKLASESRANATVVPEGAVQASERGFVAYVVEDGKARLRPVQIGLRTGTGIVEIVSGLQAGQTVVIEGSDRLADGVPVRPVGGPGAGPSGGGASAPAPGAPAGGSRP